VNDTNNVSRKKGLFGPGLLVAAAFIGPGTVTTATLAGAGFGTALLWALLFSTIATVVLQEMAARLGLATGQGLGEAIRGRFAGLGMAIAVSMVVVAIAGGNAAYEMGNLLGGALGMEGMFGGEARWWALPIAALAFVLLWSGSYRALEKVLGGLVAMMSVVFVATSLAVMPSIGQIVRGLFVPSLPDASALWVAVALIGTTVVPYNLFLHASTVSEKWSGEQDIPRARLDLIVAIGLGGLVSMAILLTSAGTMSGSGGSVENAADMARQLEPLLGRWAGVFFAGGLFAAGVTSAVTAPLAAAFATAGAMGWKRDLKSARFRAVWGGVLGVGLLLALTGIRPVRAILFAQAANGILLPAIAIFLLIAANDRSIMREHVNGAGANILGGVVVLVALGLGGRALLSVLGIL